jgi:hypothetical protein
MKKTILLLLLLILVIPTVGNCTTLQSQIKVENFTTIDNKSCIIDVSDGVYTVAQIHFGKQPEDITPWLHDTRTSSEYDIGKTSYNGQIKITLQEKIFDDATLVIFLDKNREIVGYIELMRQSQSHLSDMFNFKQKNGYTVVGRTSLWILNNATYCPTWKPLEVYTYPNLTNYYPEEKLPIEIKEIIALMRFFWKEPMRTGPDNKNYSNLSAEEQMEYLESGEWTIQCGEIRNIVASYAIQSPHIIGVKIINADQYYPRFKDLIGNVHGVMEIYSPYYDKWILVDPMFGKLFMYDGEFINTHDIATMSMEERQDIIPIKVAENSKSLEDCFNGYYLNQNYYTYYNTINVNTMMYVKNVKHDAFNFYMLYDKELSNNAIKRIGEIL